MRGVFFAISLLASLCLTPLHAQEANPDQVGLVIPAFDGEFGQQAAFLAKLLIQSKSSSEDPLTRQRGIGRGVTYYVPASMAEPSHLSAERLARLNGFQGTLWGNAVPLLDGISYTAYLTLAPPFEDFRSDKREFWGVETQSGNLVLGPPSRTVAFRPMTFSLEQIQQYGGPETLQYCPILGGSCVRFETQQVSRAREVRSDGIVMRRGSVDYFVQFPVSEISDSDPVNYAALFIAYARGNLRQAIELGEVLVEEGQATNIRVDAHLYRAASFARLGNTDAARQEVISALELAPAAARALRYGIMVELSDASIDRPSSLASTYAAKFFANYVPQNDFDETVINLFFQ